MSTPIGDSGKTVDNGFFGHPRGLSTLFFTEMWERFSYYGMVSLMLGVWFLSISMGNYFAGLVAGEFKQDAGVLVGIFSKVAMILIGVSSRLSTTGP